MAQKSSPDVRWKQRFNNFTFAFAQLKSAVEISRQRPLSDLEKQGLIKAFEFTHELAWNVIKDYLEYQGVGQLIGSRDATREGFQKGIIQEGDIWMEMILSRNQTSHTYNKKIADQIVSEIQTRYFALFETFDTYMTDLVKK